MHTFSIALIVLLSLTISPILMYHKVDHSDSKDLLHIIEGGYYKETGHKRIFLVMFLTNDNSHIRAKNDEYREAIETSIFEQYPDIYYTEVDVSNKDYYMFAKDVIGIEVEELEHAPTLLLMTHGKGVWVHGPEAVSRVARYLTALFL